MTRSLFTSLPQGWGSTPAKHAVALNPEVLSESTPADTELSYVDIAALEGGDAAASLSPKELTFGTAPSRARRVLRAGDTILSTVRTYLKAVANFPVAPGGLVASTGFAVLRPNGRLHPRFAYWAALSEPFIENVVAHSEGVSYPAINPSVLGSLHMPVPPLASQERIANFLDEQTARIDALIAEKERLIPALNEFTDAEVARLLSIGESSSEVKSTGVFWCPIVGKSRLTTKLKYLLDEHDGYKAGPFGSALITSQLEDSGDVLVLSPEHVSRKSMSLAEGNLYLPAHRVEEMQAFRVQAGDVVFPIVGSLGKAMVIPPSAPPAILNQRLARLRPHPDRVLPAYLETLLCAKSLYKTLDAFESKGSIIDHVTKDMVMSRPVFIPPKDEQVSVLKAIGDVTARCQALSAHVLDNIARLREYRSSLISAAVTGQLDISTFKASRGNE